MVRRRHNQPFFLVFQTFPPFLKNEHKVDHAQRADIYKNAVPNDGKLDSGSIKKLETLILG